MAEYRIHPYRIFLLLLSVLILVWYCKMGLQWWDFEGQWTISTYFCNQLNPYLAHPFELLTTKGVGEIPVGWGTSPWGLLLGQLLYPGFLEYHYAQIYFVTLYFVLYAIALFYVWQAFPNQRTELLLFALLASVSYFRPMLSGNAGGIMCLLLLLSISLQHKSQTIAGVLLAFAMIKPQLALLFCLYFLLRKRYVLLFVACTVDVLSWVVAAFLLDTSIVQLLKDFLHYDIGEGVQFAGIFTLAFSSSSTAMLFSMLFGIIYAVVYYIFYKGRGQLVELAPFCVAASLWSYSWGNEYLVLLPVCLLSYQFYGGTTGTLRFRWAFLVPYTMFSVIIIIAITTVLAPITSLSAFHIAMTLYSIGLLIGVYKYL